MEQKIQDSLPASELCRLCLSSSGDKVEIFGNRGREEDIVNIIALLFNCQIVQDDSWPQKICLECFEKVKEYHGFFSIVQSTEASLEKLLGPVSLPDVKVSFEETESPLATQFEVKTEVLDENSESLDTLPIEIHRETKSTPLKPKRIRKRNRRGPNKKEQNDFLIRKYANLTCELCKKSLDGFEEIREHYAVVHNTLGHVTCCNTVFKERKHLVNHVQHHEDPTRFQCTTCGRKCKSKVTFQRHLATHIPPDQRPFKCDQCSRSFLTIWVLKEHQKTHGEHHYKCDQCEKTYATKVGLYMHKRGTHEGGYTTVCEICAKVLVTREGYESHKFMHMEKKPPKLECALCGNKYPHRQAILAHLRKQHKTPVGKFKCNQCGRRTRCQGSLNYHIRTVHSTPRHACNLCDKTFKTHITLREHLASHTGIKLYSCNFCEKTFNSKANMYSHQKRMHPEEWKEAVRRKEEEANAE
ncbi:hypothetical protein DMENIID0001_170860 [Sergentomyia squamirostris]